MSLIQTRREKKAYEHSRTTSYNGASSKIKRRVPPINVQLGSEAKFKAWCRKQL